MRRILLAGAAALAAGCGIRQELRYSPAQPVYELKLDHLQALSVLEVKDESGGVKTGGTGLWLKRPFFDSFREAVSAQFGALGVPISPGGALSLDVELAEAGLKRGSGFAADVTATITYFLRARRAGETLCRQHVSGWAKVNEGVGSSAAAAGLALEKALAKAVGELGPEIAASCLYAAPGSESASAAAAPRDRRALAVVVGIERYRGGMPPANFAAADAREAARSFQSVLGVPEDRLILLTDERATRADLEKYLERWLPDHAAPGGTVYVYFAGHGAPDPATGAACLVPYDGDPEYLEQTAFPLSRLYADLGRLPARAIVILDAGFSGSGERSVQARGAKPAVKDAARLPDNVVSISASAAGQPVNGDSKSAHGLFTRSFLKGLEEKGRDLRAVYDDLKTEVERAAKDLGSDQSPQWRQGR